VVPVPAGARVAPEVAGAVGTSVVVRLVVDVAGGWDAVVVVGGATVGTVADVVVVGAVVGAGAVVVVGGVVTGVVGAVVTGVVRVVVVGAAVVAAGDGEVRADGLVGVGAVAPAAGRAPVDARAAGLAGP